MFRTSLTATALWALAVVSAQAQTPVHQWTFNGTTQDSVGTAHGVVFNGAQVVGGSLRVDGINDFVRTATIGAPIGAKTLVAWVSLDNLTQQSGSALTLQNPTGGDIFDGIVYGERTAGQWMNGSNGFARTPVSNGGGSETVTTPGQVMIAISYAADNSITLYRNGVPYGSAYTQDSLQNYPAGIANVLFGVRHDDAAVGAGTAGGNDAFLAGRVNEARIYNSALSAAQISAINATGPSTQQAALPNPLHRWSFNDGMANDSIGTAHGALINGATISGGQLSLDGINDYVDTAPINSTITTKTLVAWVSNNNSAQRSGSVLTLGNMTAQTDVFDAIVFGEQNAGQWMNGSNGFSRSPANFGAVDNSTSEVMMAISYHSSGQIDIYRDGQLYATTMTGTPISYTGGIADVLLGLRHEDIAGGTGTLTGNDQFWAGLINEARIYGVDLTQEQIQQLFAFGPNALQQEVPEPATLSIWVLVGICSCAMFVIRRKRVAAR